MSFRSVAISILVVGSLIAGFHLRSTVDHWKIGCADQSRALLSRDARCLPSSHGFVPEYEHFQSELQAWIQEMQTKKKITFAAVYFRDLVSGSWFGINEHEKFLPASLSKVPVLIAYLKAADQIPDIFTEQLALTGAYAGITNVEEAYQTIDPGKYYTVDDLLRRMIVYSDNASAFLLKGHFKNFDPSGNAVRSVYKDIGMLNVYENKEISVKSYASLFRILYNGKYLSPEMSEKGLDLLAQSIYRDALVAGVPEGTIVAHKFGIRDVPGESEKQFHDCGIVYHSLRPYLICVMTRGTSMTENIECIKQISARVFTEVTGHESGVE